MDFSIRDYTRKMRIINAFECWTYPDREELKQDKIVSMLPPMVVPKRSRNRRPRRRRSRQVENSNRSNTCFTDAGGTSASGENFLIRSNLRPRKIEDIIDRLRDKEKRLSISTSSQMRIPLPPPPPPPPVPTYPSMPPPPPRRPKTQLLSASLPQLENTLNVIVLNDDEEHEDPQMVSKLGKRADRYNIELQKINEGFLTLDEQKEELKINRILMDAEIAEESRSKFPMKRSLNKNIMVESKMKFDVNREHNMKIMKKEKDEVKFEEFTESKEILKPNAYIIEKSRLFHKKEKKGVRNNNMELNFNSMSSIEVNQPEKSSKRGSYSGLPVNNISNLCSKESVRIVKQELFDPIDSEWKHVRDPKESLCVTSPGSILPMMSLKGRDVSIGRSNKEKGKKHVEVRDFQVCDEAKRRNYYEDGVKLEPYSGSQLQISTEKVFQPMNLPINQKLQKNILMNRPNSNLLPSNLVYPNQSLGDNRNVSSNFSEKLMAQTNQQGLILQPLLSNLDRKRGHHDASSPLRLPFSSPSTWLTSSTRERLPRPSSSNSFPPNAWNMNFITPSSIHPKKAMYPSKSTKNSKVCQVSVVQPTPVANQPSAIKSGHKNQSKTTSRDNHVCSTPRKRPAVEIIDFTNPKRSPNTGPNLEGNTGEAEIGTSVLTRSRRGFDPNAQKSEKDHIN